MNRQIKNILVGTSLSKASDEVIGKALELARSTKARLHVAHAYAPPASLVGDPYVPWVDPSLMQLEAQAAREAVEAQLDRLGADRGRETGSITVRPGPADRVLLDVAAVIEADLLVVGGVEPGHLLQRLLGSTADRLLRQSTCPVLVLRGDLSLPPRRVLMPVDLSPLSADACKAGLGFLEQVSAAEPPTVEALLVLVPYPRQMPFQFSPSEARHMVARELQQFVLKASEGADHVWTNLRTGDAGAEILNELREWPADLVIVGTHGYSGFTRFLLGSVAGYVAQEAPCSVLVLPPEEALRAALAAERARNAENGVMPVHSVMAAAG